LLASSSCLALAFFFVWLRWRRQEQLEWVESDVAGARAAMEAQTDGGGTLWHYWLPEAVALELMPQIGHRIRQYDPWCYFVYRPNQVVLRLHGVEYATNRLGLRDDELREEHPALRVLVAGDSHVEGRQYPDLLERMLEERHGLGRVEVINAGHGAYSLYHYLGTLERFVALGVVPDVFVVTVFGGNDFEGSLFLWRFFHATDSGEIPASRVTRMESAVGALRHAFGQALADAEHFRSKAGEVERALECARELTEEMRERCRSLRVRLVVLFIPAPTEFPALPGWQVIESAMEYQGLTAEHIAPLERLRRDYVAWLEHEGIAHVDLYPILASAQGELFDESLHLGPEGQRLAAEALARVLADR
jgi:lysophospholipase L1-like esterase